MTEVPTCRFWMIYGLGQREPTARHWSRADADKEAKRLARANPDICFVVLEAVSAVIKRDVEVVSMRPTEDPEIPF